MAETEMVEVVIKMPKEKYDSICSMYKTFPAEMKEWGLEYIKKDTVLPEGHGKVLAIIEKNTLTSREITEEIKRLYDLKEEFERRDALMFLKGVRETLKDADQEVEYE